MQFVPHGPDVPENFLHAHEEGNVVFFCGAGISRGVGLPDFKSLVEDVYADCQESIEEGKCPAAEHEAYERGSYEIVFQLLERRLKDRAGVREKVYRRLCPDDVAPSGIHKALLTLAKTRSDAVKGEHCRVHLVTTNYDQLFKRVDKNLREYPAPLLPVPKYGKWDGLVYLHGRLSEHCSDDERRDELNTIILSSGDFGIAYLLEKWAAQFVSVLLDNYIVCFVGYSANDVIIRYILDAISADKEMGIFHQPCYAFAGCESGRKDAECASWQSKGVVPIWYEVPESTHSHQLLSDTLSAWADVYSSGINGKVNIVDRYAHALPNSSSVDDDFARRMLWALSDISGKPAEHFAKCNPDFLWLDILSRKDFGGQDLARFHISAGVEDQENCLPFGLLSRPTSFDQSGKMALVDDGTHLYARYDKPMYELAKWAANFVGKQEFFLWVVSNGGRLHPAFRDALVKSLAHLGNSVSQKLHIAWQVLLDGFLKFPNEGLSSWWNIKEWLKGVDAKKPSASSVEEFARMTRPMFSVRSNRRLSFYLSGKGSSDDGWKIEFDRPLNCGPIFYERLDDGEKEHFVSALPALMNGIIDRLDAADCLQTRLLADRSAVRYPSVAWCLPLFGHDPVGRDGWQGLIFFLKQALLDMEVRRPRLLVPILNKLMRARPGVFRRLSFAVAADMTSVDCDVWCGWLLGRNARNLWDPDLQQEVDHVLSQKGAYLSSGAFERLEAEISTVRHPGKMKEEEWARRNELAMRRAKILERTGRQLSDPVRELCAQYDSEHGIQVFRSWAVRGEDVEFNLPIPNDVDGLLSWLDENSDCPPLSVARTQWKRFAQDNVSVAFTALIRHLRKGGASDGDAIRLALTLEQAEKSNKTLGALLAMSDDDFGFLSEKFPLRMALWLSTLVSRDDGLKAIGRSNAYVRSLEACANPRQDLAEGDIYIGLEGLKILTSNILNRAFADYRKDKGASWGAYRTFFDSLLRQRKLDNYAATEVLFANLRPIYQVDAKWAQGELVGRLCKGTSRSHWIESWRGFFMAPFVSPDILLDMQYAVTGLFGDVAAIRELHERGITIVRFVQDLFVPIRVGYPVDVLKRILLSVGAAVGLEGFSNQLSFLMQQAKDASALWSSSLKTLFAECWPECPQNKKPTVSQHLAEIVALSGRNFEEAYSVVGRFVVARPENAWLIGIALENSEALEICPRSVVSFLNAIVSKKPNVCQELSSVVEIIRQRHPDLAGDSEFVSLHDLILRNR